MAAVTDLPLELIGHREIVAEAVAAAREHRLTVYEGLFLALAHKQKAELISADERLMRAAAKTG
jgi:predicted nucleic acid-binding protein